MIHWTKKHLCATGGLRRFLMMALAVMVLLPGLTRSEGADHQLNNAVPMLQPMMDLVGAAAYTTRTEMLTDGLPMPAGFVHAFFTLGQNADPSLGITPQMKGDVHAQRDYISKAFTFTMDSAANELFLEEPPMEGYLGVQFMTGTISEDGTAAEIAANLYRAARPMAQLAEGEAKEVEWLDKTAAFSFRKAADAPNGWRLAGFSFAGDHLETNVDDYFSEHMMEYINDRLGFSLLYPAEFTADLLMETEQGIQSVLPDEKASLYARRLDNEGQKTRDDIKKDWTAAHPSIEIEENATTGLLKGTFTDAEGRTHVMLMLVTPGYLYEAGLTYHQDLAKTFGLYAEYMTNSFTAAELGIG